MTRLDSRGFTLIELVVALAIVALTASLAANAFRDPVHAPTRAERIEAAREAAIERRRPVSFAADSGGAEMRAFPDGRVLGDTAADFDPLAGRARAPR
jgi:prepilin-type N-terminal cleavage/methylation domain-containing protein